MFYYVYLIKSVKNPVQTYVGYTINIKQRLADHNADESVTTAGDGPWELVTFVGFNNKPQALRFEKYLKSHSGRLFASKRLW